MAGGITSRAKMSQIAKGHYNGAKIETAKPEFIRDIVAQWPDESTIIWCRYNKEQDGLAAMFPAAANISGTTPEETRMDLIADFQERRRRVLITKDKVCGFGLNLQVCTRMVFSTLIDSYESYWQCLKRANRVGSTERLHVHVPLLEIERPMVDTVFRKLRMVDDDTRVQEQLFREFGVTL